MTQRYSRQREIILQNLQSRTDHPTAEELYDAVKERGVSLPTVYRNLAALSDSGEILRLKTRAGGDRFDATTAPHTHLECMRCRRVADMSPDPGLSVDIKNVELGGFEILDYNLTLYGLCPQCNLD